MTLGSLGYLRPLGPLGPLVFDFAQHRQTLRPTVDGIRSKAQRPFPSVHLGPSGFDFAQHEQTLDPTVDAGRCVGAFIKTHIVAPDTSVRTPHVV